MLLICCLLVLNLSPRIFWVLSGFRVYTPKFASFLVRLAPKLRERKQIFPAVFWLEGMEEYYISFTTLKAKKPSKVALGTLIGACFGGVCRVSGLVLECFG